MPTIGTQSFVEAYNVSQSIMYTSSIEMYDRYVKCVLKCMIDSSSTEMYDRFFKYWSKWNINRVPVAMCYNQASKRSIFTSNVWSGLYYLGVVFLNAEQRVKRVHSSYQASRNLKISLRRCPHKNNFNELRERFNCTFYILQVGNIQWVRI